MPRGECCALMGPIDRMHVCCIFVSKSDEDDMSTSVHGIELDAEGNPTWLRFGILRLLYHLYGTNTTERSVQDWLQRLHSEAFRHQMSHFLQCFWKFERAAGHVARCRDAVNGAMSRFGERIR